MNSITFVIVCILLLLNVSSADYISENNVTVNSPYRFRFLDSNDILLTEITLKNISPSVTAIYLVYTMKSLTTTDPDPAPERVKIDAQIKNGGVKILIQRGWKNYGNILVDVELHTREGVCYSSRVVEGKHATGSLNNDGSSVPCLVPKPCEIVVELDKQCEENFKCSLDETKYICTFNKRKVQKSTSYNLYQNYDSAKVGTTLTWRGAAWRRIHQSNDSVPAYVNASCFVANQLRQKAPRHATPHELRTAASFLQDYTYIDAVGSFYRIHKTPKNWHDAKQKCDMEGAGLFYPENRDEAEAVISFWKLYQNNSNQDLASVFVGISDITTEGKFKTIDGKSISEVYNKWRPYQPDNYGNEDCVHMNQKGEYNDIKCNTKNNDFFICKKSFPSPDPHNLSSVIGVPLYSSAVNTKLIIDLELFDNNTSVHVGTSVHRRDILWSDKMILTEKDVVKDDIVTLTYSEATEVQFSCEEYKSRSKYLSVAFVTTTENKIHTLNKTAINKGISNMADNGSFLCCLYYVYQSMNDGKEVHITRFVVNKTLLIYQHKELMSPKPADAVTIDITAIFISSVSVLILALLLMIYLLKKRCQSESNRRKSSQRSLPQIPKQNSLSEPDPNLPFYQNLLFRRECELERQAQEESHYVEVTNH